MIEGSPRGKSPDITPSSDSRSLLLGRPSALKDKQSERTTFKLTEETSNTLKSLAQEHGITMKELFETLCSDSFDSLMKLFPEKSLSERRVDKLDRPLRKTYVISKHSFHQLNKTSKRLRIPRDLLVEYLVKAYRRLKEQYLRELEESQKNHRKALHIIKRFSSRADEAKKRLREILIDYDPIVERLELIQAVIDNLYMAIESELENRTPIDPEDTSQTN